MGFKVKPVEFSVPTSSMLPPHLSELHTIGADMSNDEVFAYIKKTNRYTTDILVTDDGTELTMRRSSEQIQQLLALDRPNLTQDLLFNAVRREVFLKEILAAYNAVETKLKSKLREATLDEYELYDQLISNERREHLDNNIRFLQELHSLIITENFEYLEILLGAEEMINFYHLLDSELQRFAQRTITIVQKDPEGILAQILPPDQRSLIAEVANTQGK